MMTQQQQEQSARAKRQPRDSLGRFARFPHRPPKKLIACDEAGEVGRDTSVSSPAFIVTALVTDRPDVLRAIPDNHDKNTYDPHGEGPPDELKYHFSSHKVRSEVLDDIVKLNPRIHAVVLDKDNLPPEYDRLKHGRLHLRAIEDLMDDVMKDTDGAMEVIFHPHTTFAQTRAVNRAVRAAQDNGRVLSPKDVTQNTPSNKEPALQANDFVPGALDSKFNKGFSSPYDKIEPLVKVRIVRK